MKCVPWYKQCIKKVCLTGESLICFRLFSFQWQGDIKYLPELETKFFFCSTIR